MNNLRHIKIVVCTFFDLDKANTLSLGKGLSLHDRLWVKKK